MVLQHWRLSIAYSHHVRMQFVGVFTVFLAFKRAEDDTVFLHCPTCGTSLELPELPANHVAKALFLNSRKSLMLAVNQPENDDLQVEEQIEA